MLQIPGLHVTTDTNERVVFGITARGHAITDLSTDESGIQPIEPSYYGLSQEQVEFFNKLSKILDYAATDAVNAGCYTVRTELKLFDSDVAGAHFSNDAREAPFRTALANYILAEIAMAKA